MVSEKNEVTSQNQAIKRDVVKDHVRLMLQRLIDTTDSMRVNRENHSMKDAAKRDRE